MTKQLTLENYVLDLIHKREEDLKELSIKKDEYSKKDILVLTNRYQGSIDDLNMCLTTYNNPLSQIKALINNAKDKITNRKQVR